MSCVSVASTSRESLSCRVIQLPSMPAAQEKSGSYRIPLRLHSEIRCRETSALVNDRQGWESQILVTYWSHKFSLFQRLGLPATLIHLEAFWKSKSSSNRRSVDGENLMRFNSVYHWDVITTWIPSAPFQCLTDKTTCLWGSLYVLLLIKVGIRGK